jgi:hypothetical protein
MARGCRACTTRTAGLSTVAVGIWLLGVGLWARADVRRSLARERIVSTGDGTHSGQPVRDAAAARSPAEVIRGNTLSATEGRTYGETPSYVDAEGRPTTDRMLAAIDAVTGGPIESPEHALWVQATTLQTALMQAYLAQRLAELTAGLGATFVAVGAGLTAASRR